MPTLVCEQAIRDAQRVGRALLKFISPNDAGLTGSHQCGYYLPKEVWKIFAMHPPTKGENCDQIVEAVWQNGISTQSVVKWYGRGTRSEYRMTRFGRDFPFLAADCVGSLLVLVPERADRFLMYVLDLEDEIEDIQAALGIELIGRWALYDRENPVKSLESEDQCIDRHFRKFTEVLDDFPSTQVFSDEARSALLDCMQSFVENPCDEQLLKFISAEYRLFQMVERKVCEKDIVRIFKSVDDFLGIAQSILQRRKARAGRSLEHHVGYLLRQANIPFDVRVDVEGTKPDVLIPGHREYCDKTWPESKLFAIGIKTTCKDRWRQVLREAPRVMHKHILTVQKGISSNQLNEMKNSSVTLIIPKGLHADYPPDWRNDLLTVASFIEHVRAVLSG